VIWFREVPLSEAITRRADRPYALALCLGLCHQEDRATFDGLPSKSQKWPLTCAEIAII
jgi:hypothetical protein